MHALRLDVTSSLKVPFASCIRSTTRDLTMADQNGRARLDEVQWQFSRLAPGPSGREVHAATGGSRTPEPRIDAFAPYYGSAPAQPAGTYLGLREIYGAREEPWGSASVGITTAPGNRRHTEFPDGIAPVLRPESSHLGSWSDIFNSPGLHSPAPSPDLGGNDQMDWFSVFVAAASTVLASFWGAVQRHKMAAVLWAAVLVAYVAPLIVR